MSELLIRIKEIKTGWLKRILSWHSSISSKTEKSDAGAFISKDCFFKVGEVLTEKKEDLEKKMTSKAGTIK